MSSPGAKKAPSSARSLAKAPYDVTITLPADLSGGVERVSAKLNADDVYVHVDQADGTSSEATFDDPATLQSDVLEMLNDVADSEPKAEVLEDAATLVQHACPLE